MAKNRRNLKKFVNYITSELLAEIYYIQYYNPDVDKQQLNEVFTRIAKAQNEFVSRISHTEPGNVKGFYKKLKSDFNTEVSEIIDQLNTLN
ncbi:MAG: hypothetical protein J6M59_04715 [Bacteroidaceae bacterium]|jgi:hypothetical protein|uniref:hypothetical protein n=1 Tax=unclassified Bacteroides TaxID=2646097 RepID=UPI0004E1070E|nr:MULTISPECIES: hypothetical protein [unclassified Bacteroides]MBP3244386.1 hypothetical protein [Bacteroidaceae bacterium]SDF65711.1 hypothetical protein SAMN05216518_11080 [Bacteroidales bacterium KHT7]MBP5219683.1 hypothetical protein [Bacteroidaceae bacterium]MBQ1676431.1 hypothetical protein [Bacteroidaceae bacterium]MBQ2056021.1 hypothetical protein [Bacteroidaceae bacterium]